MCEPIVERIVVDPRSNRLILELDRALPESGATPGTIDIGTLGRLLGVEVAGVYLSIADPVSGSELQGRSVELAVEITGEGRRVVIPRRGPAWELSFPSGNQCWTRQDGRGGVRSLCSVLTGA